MAALSRPWLISALAASLAIAALHLSWALALSGFMPLVGHQPAATPHLPAPSPATIRLLLLLCKGRKLWSLSVSVSLCLRRHSVHGLLPNFLHGPWQPAPS